jgi:hypothetical protein
MVEIANSIKRLLDLIYVYAAIWGIATVIEWILQFGQ